jgi:hypothetical protein
MEILCNLGTAFSDFATYSNYGLWGAGGQLLRRAQRRASDSGLTKGFRQPYVARYLPNAFEESPVVLLYACAANSKIT